MKKQIKWIWPAIWGLIVLAGGGGTLFSWMPRTPGMFYGGCTMLLLSVMAGTVLVLMARGKAFCKACLPGLLAGAVYAALVAAILYVCDEVIFKDCIRNYQPVHSSLIVVILNIALVLAAILLMPKQYAPKWIWLKRGIALVLCGTALALSGLPQNWWWGRYQYAMSTLVQVETPVGFSSYTETAFGLVLDADFYVAVDGDDGNDGSFEKPFATVERARDAVRAMDKTGKTGITVAIKAGDYRMTNITFTAEDSGTAECPITYCAYGDGDVIFNAGVTLKPEDFELVTGSQADRLQKDARDHVAGIDLGCYGITAEQCGKLYALGSFHQASQYDGDYVGPQYCELFVNDQRQTIARYPNEGYLATGAVLDMGEPYELPGGEMMPWYDEWADMRNPRPSTYRLDKGLAKRMQNWELRDDIWMYGYWVYEWADGSTPLQNVDFDNMTITPKFVHGYGAVENAPYYFYNVYEELDAPGEWYLDLDTCVLYLYAPEDLSSAEITLSLSLDTVLVGEDVEYLTFRGFTIQGTRGDGVSITGSHNTVEHCLIKNIAGDAILLSGYENLAANNEITRTGKGGIQLNGGDAETLTPGNNRAYNNLIHDWSEIWTTYQPAVKLEGVGNICDHNEIYNAPHEAIHYFGNNHLIEYNVIHDVLLESDDAGAIYSYLSMTWYGNVIRYNAIYDLGTPGKHTPVGIYMDGGLSGQTIYGNLLVNVPDIGIKIGNGRDMVCQNNIVINTKNHGMQYCEHILFYAGDPGQALNNTQIMWDALQESPWQTEIWKEAYPILAQLHLDMDRPDDPLFMANTAGSLVNRNLFVNDAGSMGDIGAYPAKYSDISGNAAYDTELLREIFVDPDSGDYRIKEDSIVYQLIPEFENLPIAKMGRE